MMRYLPPNGTALTARSEVSTLKRSPPPPESTSAIACCTSDLPRWAPSKVGERKLRRGMDQVKTPILRGDGRRLESIEAGGRVVAGCSEAIAPRSADVALATPERRTRSLTPPAGRESAAVTSCRRRSLDESRRDSDRRENPSRRRRRSD